MLSYIEFLLLSTLKQSPSVVSKLPNHKRDLRNKKEKTYKLRMV